MQFMVLVGGQFIVYGGERYRLDETIVDADLWQLDAALARGRAAPDNEARLAALEPLLDVLDGEPLAGAAYEWAEPVRVTLRNRGVDALGDVARLRGLLGDVDGAIAALRRAREVDPYSEDVYRRLMRELHANGRDDMALRVYEELEAWLGDMGLQPEEESDAELIALQARAWASRREASTAGPSRNSATATDRGGDDAEDHQASALPRIALRRVVVRGGVDRDGHADSRLPTPRTNRPDLPILDDDGDERC